MNKKPSLVPQKEIENWIFTYQGLQVMLDKDLAELFQVDTKRLNEQVKRNLERFPDAFRFQLSDSEKNELVANCDRFKNLKHATNNPYAFTEQGVAMLSAVLRSETAIKVSIQIISAFVEMRKQLNNNNLIDLRFSNIERKQIETDQKFEQIFNALEQKNQIPQEGIFFEGQVFDAYTFVANLIKKAEKAIILIDNYVDETVLTLLTKRNTGVTATIYTKQISKQLQLDLAKHNAQYPEISIKTFTESHDRFLLLDDTSLYHIGASLKDLGKKWFAFSKMDSLTAEVRNKLN
jgi:hypothetical protein